MQEKVRFLGVDVHAETIAVAIAESEGEVRKVWGDGGSQGQSEAIKRAAPKAQDMTCKRTKFKNYVDELQKKKNTSKSRIRAFSEMV